MRLGTKKTNSFEPSFEGIPMLAARSKDNGVTWSRRWGDMAGTRPKLLWMSSGVLVCAFDRPGNNLVFSVDDGRTWGREISVTPADIRTTGYLDIVEVEPGQLLAIYDAFNMSLQKFWLWEPREVNGAFGSFVDVKRLIGGPTRGSGGGAVPARVASLPVAR